MGKTALVISGGGSKGAYAAGIVRQLSIEQPDLQFDILIGTSTGALIVPLVALDELDLLEELYTTVDTGDIITVGNIGSRLMSDNSLYDARPLGELLTENFGDDKCERLLESPKQVFVATTCLQTGNTVYFTNREPAFLSEYEIRSVTTADQVRRAVMASACQPVFMPPIELIPGSRPVRQYVDGGVREYAGVQLAIDAGAEEIFVILLSAEANEIVEKPFGNAFDILKQSLDIFVRDVGENDLRGPAIYNRALRYIDAVKRKLVDQGWSLADVNSLFSVRGDLFSGKKPLKIHVIRPESALGGGPGGLVFDPAEMRDMFNRGAFQLSSYLANDFLRENGNV